MVRINRLFTMLLLAALLLSACQPIQALAPSAAQPSSTVLSGFVENNGVRIHYEVEGQGPPLVLMHWWTGSIADWRFFGYVDALKTNYRLILIDARGHGQSDKPHDPAAYRLEQQVGDVVAVLDKLSIDKAHYFGYSMGGTIGWAVAKYAPERLLSLMIGGEAPENYDPVDDIAGIRELGAEGWGQMAADLSGSYGFLQPEIYTVYAANDVEAVVADVTAYSAENFANDLSSMTMPILLLAGTEDTDYAPLEAAAKQLPHATFAAIPGFDHTAAFLQTDMVLAQVTQFLTTVQPISATTLEHFIKGAPVRLAVGLAVGPDDNLYVGSQWTRELVVLNPDTGEIIKRYGPQDGVDIPCDLAFGPDGSLYASMYPGFEGDGVMRMTSDGKVTGTSIPPVIWPVMTTKDGRLFAGLLDQHDVIVELDPDFKAPPRELVHTGNFIHMREGPDGLIYALKWFDGEIIRFDPDQPEAVETVATGLTLPFNLAFDSKGQLYVIIGVDDSTDAVARLDLATGKQEIMATMHNMLYGLAIDSRDRIFVSSVTDGTIFEVLPTGDIRIVSPGGMILPSDVAVITRPDGASLFLADWIAWREYDIATGALRNARYGTWWPGTLANPDTITAFGDKLLIASTEGQQIQLWDPVQQKEALLISDPGVDNALAFQDAIVAANYERKDVVSIDPAHPDQRSVLADGLAYPLGLATDGANLYVGDFLGSQLYQIAADGAKLDPPKLISEGLQGPEGMALTGDGRLLVVESKADRLSIIDLATGQLRPLVTDLGLLRDLPRSRPQHYFFNGVDVDASGTIYITADRTNMIYRLPLPPK